jgi:class 3 adenylate cyclase
VLIVGLVAERATGEIALSLFAAFVHGGMSRERTMAVMRPSSAVALSAEVQQAMPERNTGFGADNRIELRIGINLGDVIVEGDDLYGDGVNIAARIEALADADGVFVSNTVHDHVRDRLPFAFEDLGEQQVKNIARPVGVYRVRGTGVATKSPALRLPDKPSLAVLPFVNLSADPEQEYFVDGVVEEMITAIRTLASYTDFR